MRASSAASTRPPPTSPASRRRPRIAFAEGIAFERKEFMKLMMGTQSAAQRHIFFAERKAAKIDGIPTTSRSARSSASA
jgi:hypothetical protein